MSNRAITDIARRIGISPATVSKVLNHSFGVSGPLREQVFEAAEAMHVYPAPNEMQAYDAYVILPEIPTYFWKELYHHLMAALDRHGLRVRFHIYSRLNDSATVERYLREFEHMDVPILIIAANYEGLDKRLRDIARRRAVFTVCETTHADNCYAIGSHQKADSALLATNCLLENPHIENILLIGRSGERLMGFVEATNTQASLRFFSSSEIEAYSASTLAQKLSALHTVYPFDIAVCLSGFTKDVCISLKKCHLSIPCYGFEGPHIEPRYVLPGGTVIQDLAAISETTAEMAKTYLVHDTLPAQKYTFVPSLYRRTGP